MPVVLEHPTELGEPRLEERQVVVEDVQVARRAEAERAVATPLEAHAVAVSLIANGPQALERLAPTRVEGRVDIDQVDAVVRDGGQDLEVVGQHDPSESRHTRSR